MRACRQSIFWLMLAALPLNAWALDEAQRVHAKLTIEKVMSSPPFEHKQTVETYRYRGEGFDFEPDEPTLPEGSPDVSWLIKVFAVIAQLSEVLLWALVALLVYLVFHYRERWMMLIPGRVRRPQPVLPSAIFGDDEAVEPIPDDVVGEAKVLLAAGDSRGALSLLYRGALLDLILNRRLEVTDSATEEDCLRLVRPNQDQVLVNYFTRLTRGWQSRAYGAIEPELALIKSLCDEWRTHFGGAA